MFLTKSSSPWTQSSDIATHTMDPISFVISWILCKIHIIILLKTSGYYYTLKWIFICFFTHKLTKGYILVTRYVFCLKLCIKLISILFFWFSLFPLYLFGSFYFNCYVFHDNNVVHDFIYVRIIYIVLGYDLALK